MLIKKHLNKYGRMWDSRWIRPCESLWGMWQRYKQVNAINDTAVCKDINAKRRYDGVNYSPDVAIYVNAGISVQALLDIFQIPDDHFNSVKRILIPVKEHSKFIFRKELVICPRCIAESGYHSYWHQLAGMTRCPYHTEQKLIVLTGFQYSIDWGHLFGFMSENIEEMEAPLPVNCHSGYYHLEFPFTKCLFLLGKIPKVNLYHVLFSMSFNYHQIAKDKDSLFQMAKMILKETALFLYDHKNPVDSFISSREEFIDNLSDRYNVKFLIATLRYKLVSKDIKNFTGKDIAFYASSMDLASVIDPAVLPNKKLVAKLRIAKAVTRARSYKYAGSDIFIYHPNCQVQDAFSSEIHLTVPWILETWLPEYCLRINRSMANEYILCFYAEIMKDYFEDVYNQLYNDPYMIGFSKIREPKYMIVWMKDGSCGYCKF